MLMLKVLFFTCLTFLFTSLFSIASQFGFELNTKDAISPATPVCKTFNMEIADSDDSRTWGLMGRKNLSPDQGMLFVYPTAKKLSFWMFNCHLDLSVAFIDKNKVIRGIEDLRAYPKLMDPNRPINSVEDIKSYPADDPICLFFESQAKSANVEVQYALEMNQGWFSKNQFKIGDLVVWNRKEKHAHISHAIDLSAILKNSPQTPLILKMPQYTYYSAWLPDHEGQAKVLFLDNKGKILNRETIEGGARLPPELKPVVVSTKPAAYLLLLKYQN